MHHIKNCVSLNQTASSWISLSSSSYFSSFKIVWTFTLACICFNDPNELQCAQNSLLEMLHFLYFKFEGLNCAMIIISYQFVLFFQKWTDQTIMTFWHKFDKIHNIEKQFQEYLLCSPMTLLIIQQENIYSSKHYWLNKMTIKVLLLYSILYLLPWHYIKFPQNFS